MSLAVRTIQRRIVRALLVNTPTYGSHLRSIPLGLLYIISSCRRAGHDVSLLDGGVFRSREAFEKELLAGDFDTVGFSAMTHNFGEVVRLVSFIRNRRPGMTILIGGVHASAAWEQVAAVCPECFVMTGEGEEAMPLVFDAMEGRGALADVPGLVWHENGVLRHNRPRPVDDLDALALPAYDLVDFSDYTIGAHGMYFKRKPLTTIITSRGCPFHCSFCAKSVLTGDTWRPRSPEGVLDEIELLMHRYGIREIHFEDDNIALDEDRFRKICQGIIDRGIDITWKCPHGIYATHLAQDTFELMARSGCYSLSFGIESGNDQVLAMAHKTSNTAGLRKTVEAARRAGIQVIGFFILGLEGETPQTIRETIDFAKSLPLDAAQFNLCVPFIGTQIRETYLDLGYISDRDLDTYDVDHAVVNLPGLSTKDMKRWRLRAFLEFYSRPSIFLRNLRAVSSVDVMKALFFRLRNIWRA
ncbi:MAG: cobalamin-dependent protein [Planctomycetes bacterium]|nr:cobalamin-dependent protein [Planctomycetota bacterium]